MRSRSEDTGELSTVATSFALSLTAFPTVIGGPD